MPGVFISYRRDDVGLVASDVADKLAVETDAKVFFDLQSILAGSDFAHEIESAMERSSVVLVLLGKDWTGQLEGGGHRIQQPSDPFRLEIESALRLDRYIIPVLVGIPAIRHSGLSPIDQLQSRQWHHIRLGEKQRDIDRLVDRVRDQLFFAKQATFGASPGGHLRFEPYRELLRYALPAAPRGPSPAEAYFFNEDINFRVNVALTSGRPLVVFGARGSGKTGIGGHVAHHLGWQCYAYQANTTTTTKDLMYQFDSAAHLRDAQLASGSPNPGKYVFPGVLWWAFDPSSAQTPSALDSRPSAPLIDPSQKSYSGNHAVVVIDDVDRMAPAVLEGLLMLLDVQQFAVPEIGALVASTRTVLPILLAENTRALDPRILPRLVKCEIPFPSIDHLVATASVFFQHEDRPVIEAVAHALAADEREKMLGRRVALQDFVSIVRVILNLKIEPKDTNWRVLLDAMGF